jgi:surface antigen
VIAPNSGATGTATASLWVFSELTGSITPGTPTAVTINIPGQTDSLTFNGGAGQVASVQISNSTFGYYPMVSILNPDGTTLTSTYAYGSSVVLGPFTLPASGTYTLVIGSSNGYLVAGSASVTLLLNNGTSQSVTAPITPATPTMVSISNPGQIDNFIFSGTTGQFVSMELTNATFGCCVSASILNPDGSTLISNYTGGTSLTLGPVALPTTGTYTLVIAPYSGSLITGNASVTLWLFSEQAGTVITPGTLTPVAINTPGQSDTMTFSGTAGQYASVQLANSTFACCVAVSILNPDGSTLISNNTAGSSLSLGSIALPATGTYTLVIAPYNDNLITGTAQVTLWLFSAPTSAAITPGTPTAVAISIPGQSDSLTFTGTAGQYASLQLSNSSFGCCASVSILNPDGSTLISNYTGSASLALGPVALPVTGTYSLVIAPYSGNLITGSASVTLWLFSEQTGATILPGTSMPIAINIPGQSASMTFSGNAGQNASVQLSSSTFGCCAVVSILNPDGSTLISNNATGASLTLGPDALPETGTYTLVIAPYSGYLITGSANVTLNFQ